MTLLVEMVVDQIVVLAVESQHHLGESRGVLGEIFGAKRHTESIPRKRPESPAKQSDSADFRRSLRHLRDHPRPLRKAFDQHRQLRPRHPHRPLPNRRPGEVAVLKPLGRQNKTRAVKNQELQAIRSLRAEHENVAAVGLAGQPFRHQRDQAVYAFAKIDRLRRNEHPDIRAERNHRVDLTAVSTRSSVAASTPTGTRTVAPAIVTSIRSVGPAKTRGWSIASGRASTASSSLSWTNFGPSLDASRALRRHTLSNPRLTPLGRATSEMFTPGSALSARIRAFSSSLQSRRRRRPVITSTR